MDSKKILESLHNDLSLQGITKKTLLGMSTEPLPAAPLSFPIPPSQEEVNQYQSSGALMRQLADEAKAWVHMYKDSQEYTPVVLAVLPSGMQIAVETISEVGFHGIRVTGTINALPCSVLCHQASFQMVCMVAEKNKQSVRRPIGFVWNDETIQI